MAYTAGVPLYMHTSTAYSYSSYLCSCLSRWASMAACRSPSRAISKAAVVAAELARADCLMGSASGFIRACSASRAAGRFVSFQKRPSKATVDAVRAESVCWRRRVRSAQGTGNTVMVGLRETVTYRNATGFFQISIRETVVYPLESCFL